MLSIHRLLRIVAGVVSLLLAVTAASIAQAQTVSNPRIAEFQPSSDHNTTLPDGRPALSDYGFEIYYAAHRRPSKRFRSASRRLAPTASFATTSAPF